MSVNIRTHPRGGWDVDINVLLATGDRHRERRKLSASYSKTTAREWGERREREARRASEPRDDAAVLAPESGGPRRDDPAARKPRDLARSWRQFGDAEGVKCLR